MTTSLLIMFIATGLLTITGTLAWIFKKEILLAVCCVILAMQACFGYLLIGNVVLCYTEKTPVQVEIVKNSTTVFVSCKANDANKTFEFKSHEDYTKITDSTCIFNLVTYFNMYNAKTNVYELEYKLINEKE